MTTNYLREIKPMTKTTTEPKPPRFSTDIRILQNRYGNYEAFCIHCHWHWTIHDDYGRCPKPGTINIGGK